MNGLSSPTTRLWACRLFAAACAALGIVEICASVPLPGLHPWPWTNELIAWLSGALLLAASLWLLRRSHGRAGGWGLAALWFAAFGFAVHAASQAPADPTGWVSAAQCLTFAAAALAAPTLTGREPRLALSLILGATLVGFGVVHWLFREAIAGLIPDWMPLRPQWPWVTGAVMVACGVALFLDLKARWAALVISLMFLSWILLVHIPRLIGDPTSGFEWTFALTAVALIGAILLAGARDRRA